MNRIKFKCTFQAQFCALAISRKKDTECGKVIAEFESKLEHIKFSIHAAISQSIIFRSTLLLASTTTFAPDFRN